MTEKKKKQLPAELLLKTRVDAAVAEFLSELDEFFTLKQEQ